MNHTPLLTSHHALEEVLSTLRAHQIMPSSLKLVGLLGVGNNATVFAATIDGSPYVLKVYAAKDRMLREIRNLRTVNPRRRVITWEDQIEGFNYNFFIVEMPPGRPLKSGTLTPPRIAALTEQMLELHRVRYKDTVSVASLKRRLRRTAGALEMVESLGLRRSDFEQLYAGMETLLSTQAPVFAVSKSRIHGDLWWPNILTTTDGAYLIDWDELRQADPAEDFAKLRIDLWFSQNAFPSRNFFWTGASHGPRVRAMMTALVGAQTAELGGDLLTRLRFYLPLYGLYQLALWQAGESTTEPVLRPHLYNLLARDILHLAADPLAAPPNLRGTRYYNLVRRSRVARLDEEPND